MDHTTNHTSVITAALPLAFADPGPEGRSLEGVLRYDPADPYAVTTTFRTGGLDIHWTFARDLMIEGVFEPVGDGDVHLWPCLNENGSAVLMIELVSENGGALVEAPTSAVQKFITEMLAAVPQGSESAHLDIDAELTTFFDAA